MLTQEECRLQILDAWRRWAEERDLEKPNGTQGFVFFGYLQQHKPHLFAFRYSGDKWQLVHGWLLRAGLVSD
jgi:hypothetical protein